MTPVPPGVSLLSMTLVGEVKVNRADSSVVCVQTCKVNLVDAGCYSSKYM